MAEDALPADDEAAAPDEELVAYLDGELDPRAARAVEAKLARDGAARTKADALRKTYDLLDYLPKPEPSSTFATRTLTKLEPVSAPLSIPPASGVTPSLNASQPTLPPRAAGWAIIAWSVAALLAAGGGYLVHLIARPHLEAKAPPLTSHQVRLLERLPLYLGVDDLAYLQKLDDNEFFGDHDGEPEPPAAKTIAPAEGLSSADLARLEKTFSTLPVARQQQLRQLDDDFSALDPAAQARLNVTLERYAVWLDRIPEAYRKEVFAAPAAAERLETVRRVRNRLWREHLPAAIRAKLDETANQDEADRIREDYKHQETERRHIWAMARQQWSNLKSDQKPFPFNNAELTKQVEDYVTTVLKPRLSLGDRTRLEEFREEAAHGGFVAWYIYGASILTAAEAHPSLPEPKTGKPVTKVDDFAAYSDFLRKLRPPGVKVQSNRKEYREMPQHGKWPEFAEVIAREAQERGVAVPIPLGPCRPGEFKPEVEESLAKLLPKLTAREKLELDALQGKWPAYPKLMIEDAKKYDVVIPGVMLPGAPSQWAKIYPPRAKR